MASAGMTCQLTQRNHGEVARPLALQASLITMCKWMWDAFWNGAEEIGIRTLLRAHPGLIEKILCVGWQQAVDRSRPNRPLRGGLHLQSEEATMFVECFIIDCEDGKVTYNNASDSPPRKLCQCLPAQ